MSSISEGGYSTAIGRRLRPPGKWGFSTLDMRALFAIAFVFSAVTLLLLPSRPVGIATVEVEITATGERDVRAKSSEVWIVSPGPAAIKPEGEAPQWRAKNGMFGSFETQPATLRFAIDVSQHSVLELATNPYAGVATLRIAGAQKRENLYSVESGVRRIELQAFSKSSIDVVATAVQLGGKLVCAFVGFVVLTLVLVRTGAPAPSGKHGTFPLALLYALPSIAVYAIVQLAFWPGQMSPDSLDQWWQLHSGNLSDAHPILSTGIYSAARIFSSNPAFAVAVQYLFFALITGVFLAEMRQWGISNGIVFVTACLVPMVPGNFFIATTLWKDVPYAGALLWLTYGSLRLIRKDFRPNRGDYVVMGVAGLLVTGLRHNGIVVTVLFFAAMWCIAPRPMRARVAGLLALECIAFVLLKTVVLSALHVSPIAPQYRAIVGVHVVGAMLKHDAALSASDRALLERVLPIEQWAESYRCDTVVPIFWNAMLSRAELASQAMDVNRVALKLIAANPLVYLRHQLCVTRLIWRIRPVHDEWLPISTLEITDIERARELGLRTESKLEPLKRRLGSLHEYLGKAHWWSRPAAWLIAATLVAVILCLTVNRCLWLIVMPGLLNAVSLFPIIGAQDFRYLWPSVAVSIMAISFGIFVPKRRSCVTAQAQHQCRGFDL